MNDVDCLACLAIPGDLLHGDDGIVRWRGVVHYARWFTSQTMHLTCDIDRGHITPYSAKPREEVEVIREQTRR